MKVHQAHQAQAKKTMGITVGSEIKAVLFDHDDTLVDTIGAKWKQHKHIARTYYNKEITDADIRQHWGKPLPQMAAAIYGTDDVEQAVAHNLAAHADFPKPLLPYSLDILKRVHAAEKKVGIITATSRFSLEYDLRLHNIPLASLDYTQVADETEFHKPDPRVFLPTIAWLSREQITPKEAVYIGDGLHDMRAAEGAGMQFIGVSTGLVTLEQFLEAGSRVVNNLSELIFE